MRQQKWSRWKRPKIEDEEQGLLIAETLSELLDMEYEEVLELVQEKASWAVVKKGVEKEVTDQIRAFINENDLNCIFYGARFDTLLSLWQFPVPCARLCRNGSAGPVRGWKPITKKSFRARRGGVITATNAAGDEMPFAYEMYYDAEDGNSLVLDH